jgi:hypothetical protein
MTFGKKKDEVVAVQPAMVQAPVAFTFLERERLHLIAAKEELMCVQQKVAHIQANVAWLELNPMAEKVFRDLLDREFNSRLEAEVHARDRRDLDALVQRGGTSGQEKEKGQGQASAGTK